MQTKSGFTLVELSIVLVILGLLTGGVLTGQSLIRASELRSVTTQFDGYVTAVQTFRDKYFALPGDMTNATSYWGIAGGSGNDSTCWSTSSTDSKTCNGDGNGKIDGLGGTNPVEVFRFWQQLANAGLIEGSYDGTWHGVNHGAATTANSPSGKINGSLWLVGYVGYRGGYSFLFDGDYGNWIEFGGQLTNWDPQVSVLTPSDAYNIDMKMDDGKPATGKLAIRTSDQGGYGIDQCTDTSSSSNLQANYKLSNPARACTLLFRNIF